MFRKMVVCTDGSPYGDVACRYGFHLASALKASLTGLHVLDVRMIEGPLLADVSGAIGATGYYAGWPQFKSLMEAKGEAIRRNFHELALNAGSNADLVVETGHPVHAILDQEKETDLLILGQRGENEQFGRDLMGSVVDRVTRRATIPCLITPGQYHPVQMVIAACDGSPISGKVALVAASVAQALNASLMVLTVTDKMTGAEANDIARTAERACIAAGCPPKVSVVEGHASEAILDSIAREKGDMIVMGAHSHSRIRQWFVGCTTQHVLADSGIPALLVR
jgi:nucleotide-binding universal stress UspA family protein